MTARYHNLALDTAVFVCGAVVMIYEIIGSRIVSPYIGASIYIWTSLIGVILGSLSLGYWVGGRVADKGRGVGVLASVIFAAGGLVAVTILIKDVVLSVVASSPTGLEIKALVASVLLFAPASVPLGMVTPFAVRLRAHSLEDAGRTVGSLYAISTVGSIVGTFSAGFFLVPFVGSIRTLYLLAVGLFAVSLALAPLGLSRAKLAALLVLILGITSSEVTRLLKFRANELVDIDTQYSHVQVFVTDDPYTGRRIRAFATDPYFAQSGTFLDSDELVFPYSRHYRLLRHFRPGLERVLMIGGGGFSYPKQFLRDFQTASMDVVEIDPGVTEIARKYFRLSDDRRLNVIHEDGRAFIGRAAEASYDAVLIDAFGSLFSVPYHLTTTEAVSQMSRVLKPDGVLIVNIGSAFEGPADGFFRAELATYRSVFRQVYAFKVNSERRDTDLQNIILIAFKTDRPVSLRTSDTEFADLLSHRVTREFQPTLSPLTDDLAPVEYYNSIAQRHLLDPR